MISLFVALLLPAYGASSSFQSDLTNFKNKSLSIQSEKQNLEAASDLLLSKKLFWTPKLSVSAHQTQTKVNSDTTSDYNYLQADLSINAFRGGSDLNSLFAASADKKAQELRLLNEGLATEIKASNLIFSSVFLTESLRIQEQFLKLKEESLKIVKDRYQQGKLPSQEMIKSEVDLTQQKNKLRLATLEVLENRTNISSSFVTEIQTKEWPFNEKTNLQSQDAADKIPLIEQKFWSAKSREEAWRASKGGHWPSIDLQLQYQESEIQRRENSQIVGLISLTLPLWDRFETSAQISNQFAQYTIAQNDYKSTEQTLKQRSAFLKEKIAIARVNLTEAKKNAQIARKLYEDILRSFRTGRISTNDLFIEQNRLLESENTLALTQLTFHQGLIESCTLAGLTSADCLR